MSELNNPYESLFPHSQLTHLNLLRFPDDPNTYNFSMDDLELVCPPAYGIISNTLYTVKQYLHHPSERQMAIKFLPIPINDEAKTKKFLNEISIFQQLNGNENVVQLYGICIHEAHILICIELCDMSLKEFYPRIHKKYNYFPEELLGYMITSIINSLCNMEEVGIIHRDIKPSNILLKNGQIKICDFGEARILEDGLASTFNGTISYMAPERLDSLVKYDSRVDVWSLGITMAEIILDKLPYVSENGSQNCITFLLQLKDCKSESIISQCFQNLDGHYCGMIKNFLQICLDTYETRPNFQQLRQTSFYKRYALLSKEYIAAKYFS